MKKVIDMIDSSSKITGASLLDLNCRKRKHDRNRSVFPNKRSGDASPFIQRKKGLAAEIYNSCGMSFALT